MKDAVQGDREENAPQPDAYEDRVLHAMKSKFSHIAVTDPFIRLYGRTFFNESVPNYQLPEIRKKIALTAELLNAARQVLENETLTYSDLLTSSNYNTIVAAIRSIAKVHAVGKTTDTFKKPYKALSLVDAVKSSLHYKIASGPPDADLTHLKIQIEGPDFSRRVLKYIANGKKVNSFGKTVELPLRTDVASFHDLLTAALRYDTTIFSKYAPAESAKTYVEKALSYIIFFNKSRPNEPAKLCVKDVAQLAPLETEVDPEFLQSIDSEDRAKLGTLYKTTILSNKNKCGADIYFDQLAKSCLEVILDWHRMNFPSSSASETSGAPDDTYVFSVPSSRDTFLNGSRSFTNTVKSVRAFAQSNCKPLKRPELLVPGLLRKAFATRLAVAFPDLQDKRRLARQLNHSLETHDKHYVLPSAGRQILTVLNAIEIFNSGGPTAARPSNNTPADPIPSTSSATEPRRHRQPVPVTTSQDGDDPQGEMDTGSDAESPREQQVTADQETVELLPANRLLNRCRRERRRTRLNVVHYRSADKTMLFERFKFNLAAKRLPTEEEILDFVNTTPTDSRLRRSTVNKIKEIIRNEYRKRTSDDSS